MIKNMIDLKKYLKTTIQFIDFFNMLYYLEIKCLYLPLNSHI